MYLTALFSLPKMADVRRLAEQLESDLQSVLPRKKTECTEDHFERALQFLRSEIARKPDESEADYIRRFSTKFLIKNSNAIYAAVTNEIIKDYIIPQIASQYQIPEGQNPMEYLVSKHVASISDLDELNGKVADGSYKSEYTYNFTFTLESIPMQLKWKSRIIQKKKTIEMIDKLTKNRTFFKKDDYAALHRRVCMMEKKTCERLAEHILPEFGANSIIECQDKMETCESGESLYIIRINIKLKEQIEITEETWRKTESFIVDTIQSVVFNVNLIPGQSILVRSIDTVEA